MTTASTKKAICYYRVSSQHQQERQSISMQKTRLHKFARDKGYKIVAEYQDDGISGEDIDKRPGFQEVLETIQNDSADVLLVYMVDRIGRFKKRKDRHYITQLLEDNQVSVDSPYHSLYDCKSEEDLNKLEADLVESRRDNKMRGIRISEGHMEVRRRGGYSGGQMPYGYKYDKKKKKFSVDEPRNETLKTIIELLTQGWGLQKVARLLNSDPKKYPLARKKKYKSVGWWPATIRNIVMNDLYFTGILTPKKKKSSSGEDMVAVDTGIKLFSKEEIMEARRKMAERCTYDSAKGRKDLKSQFLLAGFLKCGECGRTIGPHLSKQKNGPPLRYYRCRGYNHDLCSRKKGYRADELEDVVMYNSSTNFPGTLRPLKKPFWKRSLSRMLTEVSSRLW